jgi:hypothetical protein
MVYFDLALQTLLLHDAAEKASMNHSCPFQAVAKSFWRTKQNPDVLNQSSKSAKAHKKMCKVWELLEIYRIISF